MPNSLRPSLLALQVDRKEEVEEAVEAQPSPEAHAFKSLNQSSHKMEELRCGGKHSRNSSNGSIHALDPVEIPLEDMSKKAKELVLASRELFPSHRLLAAESAARTRSSSYSPKRGRRHSSGSQKSAGGSRGTSSSRNASPLSVASSGSSDRSGRSCSGEGKRERAGSCPSPRHSPQGGNSAATSGSISHVDVTSFIKKDRKHARAKRIVIGAVKDDQQAAVGTGNDKSVEKQERVRKVSEPKTLTPAQTPALSLITCDIPVDAAAPAGLDSPKLLPPADAERIRSLSNVSGSSEGSTQQIVQDQRTSEDALPGTSQQQVEEQGMDISDSQDSAELVGEQPTKPPDLASASPLKIEPKTTVSVEGASISAEKVERATGEQGEATEQLSRLAKSSPEQYSTFEDEPSHIELSPSKKQDGEFTG